MEIKIDDRGNLRLTSSGAEAEQIRHLIGAFVMACQSRYPGISHHLRRVLLRMKDLLPHEVRLTYRSMKPFLRWCITDGRHLQDERRDNARRLWEALFTGPFPDFVRWDPVLKDYVEDANGYFIWCASQERYDTNIANALPEEKVVNP
jgi:hypothetical protein